MSIKRMSDYLPIKTADYTAVTLEITPHSVLNEEGEKKQIVHEFDSGIMNVYNLGTTYFNITLQWDYLTDTEAGVITDLYHNPNKADGRRKTFYWKHPTDGKTYVVRFMAPLVRSERAGVLGAKAIPNISLRVEGVKA